MKMEDYSTSDDGMSSLEDEEDSSEADEEEPVFEKCLLGNSVADLPQEMCDQKDIFLQVVSEATWTQVLTPEQRTHLKKFLPHFGGENDEEEKNKTLKKLFANENIKFGNPIEQFFKKLKGGFLSPGVSKIASLVKKARYKEYKYQQYHYHYQLIQDVLISRKLLLDAASGLPPHHPIRVSKSYPHQSGKSTRPNLVEDRTRCRYFTELQEVREECGELETSSDDENYPDKNLPKLTKKYKKQLQNMEAALSPDITRISSTTSSIPSYLDNSVSPPIVMFEVTEDKYRDMLTRHKRRRMAKEAHPELDVDGITLDDILIRTNVNKRPLVIKSEVPIKKKIKEEPKMSPEGSQPEDEVDIMSDGEERSPSVHPQPCCFFSLLRDFFYETPEQKMSASKLEEKVRCWQEVPAILEWALLHDSWTESVPSALKFLAGDLIGIVPENFVPYLDYKEKQQQWQWIGAGRDSEELLGALCQHWMENKEDVYMDSLESTQGSVPPPRVITDWSVRPTTDMEKKVYQDQECVRYQNPHRAFTFRVHGYESVVGPVKGVYGKESGVNKAREHSLLVSDRPPFVTILSLVRDAAARLPNGEGTRADICELLKDSQYLAPANDQQIHTVVSGALDRLHYEKDPCVKYDVNRKLWIYLHRNRTEDEFERIHQAQAAAAKAKKAIQKNKIPRIQKNKADPDSNNQTVDQSKGTVSPRTQSSPKPKPPPMRSLSLPNTQIAAKPTSESMNPQESSTLSMLVQSPNSRPPSQGSLPSPKTVIANVNAAQFVGQNSSEPSHSPSPPISMPTAMPDLCPSSPTWVGQPPVLQPAPPKPRTVNSSPLSGFQTIVIKQEGGKPIATLPLTSKNKPMMARVMSLSNLMAKPPSSSSTATSTTTTFRFQGGNLSNFMQPMVTGTPIQLATSKLQAAMGGGATGQPKLITLNQSMLQFDTSQSQAASMILASAAAASSNTTSTGGTPTVLLTTQGSGGLKPTSHQTYVMTAPGTSPTVVMATTNRGGITPLNLKALQGIKVIPMAQAVKGGQHLLARIIAPSTASQISLRQPPMPPQHSSKE